jgi:hypothetical protein
MRPGTVRTRAPVKLATSERLQHRMMVSADENLLSVRISASADGEDMMRVERSEAAPGEKLRECANARGGESLRIHVSSRLQ